MWVAGPEPRRMSAEIYKGIEFVRISKLPEEQKQAPDGQDAAKLIANLRKS